MEAELHFSEVEKNRKYLGIPSDWSAFKKQMFSWILAKVNMKLEGWKENLISKVSKEILIKAVIHAFPHVYFQNLYINLLGYREKGCYVPVEK